MLTLRAFYLRVLSRWKVGKERAREQMLQSVSILQTSHHYSFEEVLLERVRFERVASRLDGLVRALLENASKLPICAGMVQKNDFYLNFKVKF